MLTSSMSVRGWTPIFRGKVRVVRINNKWRLTELLDGSFQLLVLTDGLGDDNLLGSSLGAYSHHKLDETINSKARV